MLTWTFEELDEANPGRTGAATTPLREMRRLGALTVEVDCKVSDELERRVEPYLAALFQLPYSCSTGGRSLRVPLADSGVAGELELVPCAMTFDRKNGFESKIATDGDRRGFNFTQCVLIMPYWGLRAKYFSRYEESFRGYELQDRIIVPQADSWFENRPIRASDFEERLPGRVVREVQAALRAALPAISIVSQYEMPIPPKLYGYHVITKPGRIRQSSEINLLIDAIISTPSKKLPDIDLQAVHSALTKTFRTFNDFEQQLFAMRSLLDEGEITSAHVGTIGLVEWMLRFFTGQPDGKHTPFAAVMKHPAIDELPKDLIDFLELQRPVRNDFVHGRPIGRNSLVIVGDHRDRGRQIETRERQATFANVDRLISVAFALYRAANSLKPGFAKSEFH